MSNSTLLLQAKADLITATMCVDNNDKYVRLHAAYCVQQSIEKTLKYLLLLNSDDGSYPWGHDIGKLVYKCEKSDIYVPEFIKNKADVFSSWEADTRYDSSLIVRRDSIHKAISVVSEWHKDLSEISK